MIKRFLHRVRAEHHLAAKRRIPAQPQRKYESNLKNKCIERIIIDGRT